MGTSSLQSNLCSQIDICSILVVCTESDSKRGFPIAGALEKAWVQGIVLVFCFHKFVYIFRSSAEAVLYASLDSMRAAAKARRTSSWNSERKTHKLLGSPTLISPNCTYYRARSLWATFLVESCLQIGCLRKANNNMSLEKRQNTQKPPEQRGQEQYQNTYNNWQHAAHNKPHKQTESPQRALDLAAPSQDHQTSLKPQLTLREDNTPKENTSHKKGAPPSKTLGK